jgi:hypothetical protein
VARRAHITPPSPLFHLRPPVVSGRQIFAAVQSAARGRAETALLCLPQRICQTQRPTLPSRALFLPHLSLSSFTCTHLLTAQASVYSIATSFAFVTQCLFFRKVISLVSQTSRISFLVWSRLVSPGFQEKKKLSLSSVANYSFVVELRPSSS